MQGAGPVHNLKDGSSPRVVVAGEFSTGKSSLINLLLRQRILQPSVGLQTQFPTLLRHGSEKIVNACRGDGSSHQFLGIDEATALPDVAEIELYLPFERFPGVEIQELPAPIGREYLGGYQQAAATADVLLWCTIGSQPWRLSEKDLISKLARRPDQTTILCVMRDDLIRSDSDRAKINRRLQTEARPFFTDIVFINASTKSVQESMTDDAAWHRSGADTISSAISRLPGANVAPRQEFKTPTTARHTEPTPQQEPVSNVVSLPDRKDTTGSEQPTPPKSAESEETLDQLMTEALDILLQAVGELDGCHYAAVVIDAKYIKETGNTANLTNVAAARALYFAQMRDAEETGPVEEIIIRAGRETHLLSAIDGASHLHLVLDSSVTALASIRVSLRKLKESAATNG